MNDVRRYTDYGDYVKAKRQTYLANWLTEKILPVVALIVIVGIIFLGFALSNLYDHKVFQTVPEGKITVVESNKTVFIPKGAYVSGEVHLYSSNDDVVFDDTLPENQPLKAEELVKTYGRVVVYWSFDQRAAAESMLDS